MGYLRKLAFLSKKQLFQNCNWWLPADNLTSSHITSNTSKKGIKHYFNHWIPETHHNFSKIQSGMVSRAEVVLMIGFLGMVYQATQLPPLVQLPPSPPKHDNAPGNSSSKIKLRDGRFLAYMEKGVPKHKSKFKIILVHGFGSSKEMNFLASQALIEELGIYFLLFDRAGYGESDPNPMRTAKSEALDIQELADQLQITKFYLIGISMGSYPIWSCLKHIPHRQNKLKKMNFFFSSCMDFHLKSSNFGTYLKDIFCRLAGAALIVPVINYRWPSLPKNLIKSDYRRKLIQWALWFSYYAPGLLHWWVTQQWLPSTSALEKNPFFFCNEDKEILTRISGFPMLTQESLRERDVFDTLRLDFMAGFGDWDFDPVQLRNPFPQNESCVHLWQGYEDKVVPFQIQRYISGKLPWIRYHEVPHGGHLIVHYGGLCEAVLKALLLGEEPPKLEQFRP